MANEKYAQSIALELKTLLEAQKAEEKVKIKHLLQPFKDITTVRKCSGNANSLDEVLAWFELNNMLYGLTKKEITIIEEKVTQWIKD